MLETYSTYFNYYFIILVVAYLYGCIVLYFKRPISKVLQDWSFYNNLLFLGLPALFGYVFDFAVSSASREPIYLGPILGTVVLLMMLGCVLLEVLTEYRKTIPDQRNQ